MYTFIDGVNLVDFTNKVAVFVHDEIWRKFLAHAQQGGYNYYAP